VNYIPLIGISRPVAKLLSQFVNYILENNRIDVLPKKVEKEPVSNIAFANYGVDAFFFYSPVSKPENKCPDIGTEDYNNSVHNDHAGEEAEKKEPEPDKNIDFLIDYIERKNA